MLPIFGPSSPRDTVGLVADRFLDPVTVIALDGDIFSMGNAFTWTRTGVAFVSGRERTLEALAELERGQDYYAAVRSAYRQRRAADIRNEDANTTLGPRFRFGADTD